MLTLALASDVCRNPTAADLPTPPVSDNPWDLWGIVLGDEVVRVHLGTFTTIEDMCAARHIFRTKYLKHTTCARYRYISALCDEQWGWVE